MKKQTFNVNKTTVCITIVMLFIISVTAMAAPILKPATQSYYIDPQHNLWINISMNCSAQHFNVYNTFGKSMHYGMMCI
jgi:hypothetical protein